MHADLALARLRGRRTVLWSVGNSTAKCAQPWSSRGISSTGRAPALQAGDQGFDSPILHSRNNVLDTHPVESRLRCYRVGVHPLAYRVMLSGGVAERYCSSLLASRRVTRGWGFESLRLRKSGTTGRASLRNVQVGTLHGGRGVTATRWSVTPQSTGSTPSDRPNALVAQRIAHRFPGPAVAGSSPAKGTAPPNPCSSTDRAPAYEADGWEFDSLQGYFTNTVPVAQSAEAAGLNPAGVRVRFPSGTPKFLPDRPT